MYTRKDNEILRKGQVVAKIVDGKTEYVNDGLDYRLPIAKFIKKSEPVEALPVKKVTTKEAVQAQGAGFNDCIHQLGYFGEKYEGILLDEYNTGYKLAGGSIPTKEDK